VGMGVFENQMSARKHRLPHKIESFGSETIPWKKRGKLGPPKKGSLEKKRVWLKLKTSLTSKTQLRSGAVREWGD